MNFKVYHAGLKKLAMRQIEALRKYNDERIQRLLKPKLKSPPNGVILETLKEKLGLSCIIDYKDFIKFHSK